MDIWEGVLTVLCIVFQENTDVKCSKHQLTFLKNAKTSQKWDETICFWGQKSVLTFSLRRGTKDFFFPAEIFLAKLTTRRERRKGRGRERESSPWGNFQAFLKTRNE
jgi:hypothetical protein